MNSFTQLRLHLDRTTAPDAHATSRLRNATDNLHSFEEDGLLLTARTAADGAERKRVSWPTDFRSPPENGHSRYGHLMARFAPKPPRWRTGRSEWFTRSPR